MLSKGSRFIFRHNQNLLGLTGVSVEGLTGKLQRMDTCSVTFAKRNIRSNATATGSQKNGEQQ
jgi:hypothetical protein